MFSLLKNNLFLFMSLYKCSISSLFYFSILPLLIFLNSVFLIGLFRLEYIISRLVISNLYLDFSLIFVVTNSIFLHLYKVQVSKPLLLTLPNTIVFLLPEINILRFLMDYIVLFKPISSFPMVNSYRILLNATLF